MTGSTHKGHVYEGETWAESKFRPASMLITADSTEEARTQIKARVEQRGYEVVRFNGAQADISVLVRRR